jgi:hypothetical protein
MTRIKGTLVVTDPTEVVLVGLLSMLLHDPAESDALHFARTILGCMGTPTSCQLGPGLEAVTGDGRKANEVTLMYSRFVAPAEAGLARAG